MTYEEAIDVFSGKSKDVDVLKFELALRGSLQDIDCFKQLIKELVDMYHSFADESNLPTIKDGALSMKQTYFSDDILSCISMLVADASYGAFKDCLLDNQLRKVFVDMQMHINTIPRSCHAFTTYGY